MFIPRHPVVENQFCSYDAQTSVATGIGGVLCYAGAVLYLDSTATNQEAIVIKLDHAAGTAGAKIPFGFAMQKVKTGYHNVHPAGFMMPGDLGSSDVIAQPSYSSGAINGTKEAPLGVAHLGIWDTVHYTAKGTGGTNTAYASYVPSAVLAPGASLSPAGDEGKLTNSNVVSDSTDYNGEFTENNETPYVARVVKGASVAKITANCQNTTLYPIRVKLLI
jgi:hypothetical protein